MTRKKDDLENTDLNNDQTDPNSDENINPKGEDLLDDEEGKGGENLSDDNDTKSDTDTENGDDDGDMISMKAYKSLQRRLSEKDRQIDQLESERDDYKGQLESIKSDLEKGDKVRSDLEDRITKTNQRLEALENENQQSKKEAMKSRVIMNEFPELAHLESYIPEADDEETFKENCRKFAEDLGEEVTSQMSRELDTTTLQVDDESKKVSQVEIDRLHSKAMSLAGVNGKEEEYDEAMDAYLAALDRRDKQ